MEGNNPKDPNKPRATVATCETKNVTGTFGLASYTVSKRLRELSIRVALGARAKQVLSAALGRMLILLVGGSVVGMLLGVAATRVLSAIVYQASAQDPFVLAAVA
jgi:ABC-type antimicrobial peptide transport system permease subunit